MLALPQRGAPDAGRMRRPPGRGAGTRAGPAIPIPTAAAHPTLESAPLCPWREPERDLRRFFPNATGSQEELRILSHLRVALIHDLGRPLTAEEMLLRPYHVVRDAAP